MAPLNPSVQPTNDPNYRGYSQAINVPDTIKPQGVGQNTILPRGQEIGDRSAEFEGKAQAYKMAGDATQMEAYGDLFKNITEMGAFMGKAGVAVVKKDIEDKVYEVADRERQSYTEALEQIKAAGQTNNIMTGAAAAGGDLPQEVQDLGDHLATLRSAKDGGKISSTYYESRLLSEAKKLRAQYPGFRNEIDQEFARVTGSNPANAYVRALTMDINKAATGAAAQMKAAQSFVLQRNEYPGAQEMLAKIQTGQAGLQEATMWAAPYDQEMYGLKRQSQVLQLGKQTREEQKVNVGALVDKAAGIAVGRVADDMAIKMGLNTAEDVTRLDQAIKGGLVPTNQVVAWGNELKQKETLLRVKMNADALKSGATAILGQEEVNKRIDQAVQPLKDLQDSIYGKDVGTFYTSQQYIKARNDDTQRAILEDPKLGPDVAVMNALKNQVGEQNLQKLSMDIIKGDYPQNHKAFMQKWTNNFAVQHNMKTAGVPVTFNDAIDKIQKTEGLNNKRMNAALMDEVKKIQDKSLDDQTRMNYALAAFSPQNRGMIAKLNPDGVDSKGNNISGQAAVFQKFTSPEMTKAMWELGQKDRQAWKNYTDWAAETIQNDLMTRDVGQLSVIRNPAIKVGWDSDNKRLEVKADVAGAMRYKTGGGSVLNPEQDPEYMTVQRTVGRMNGYLGNYKNIAEAAGIPVDAFLIKAIANSQGGNGREALQNTQGIPFQLLRDLGLSQMKGIGSK
jgi:hypothetical protein